MTKNKIIEDLKEQLLEKTELLQESGQTIDELKRRIEMIKIELKYMTEKFIQSENRRVVLQEEARMVTRDTLVMQLSQLKPRSDILLISANRASLADQGTFAQMSHMVRTIAPKVRLTIFVPDNIKVESLTEDELGRRGLLVIPFLEDWESSRSLALKTIEDLIDKYAVSKDGLKLVIDEHE